MRDRMNPLLSKMAEFAIDPGNKDKVWALREEMTKWRRHAFMMRFKSSPHKASLSRLAYQLSHNAVHNSEAGKNRNDWAVLLAQTVEMLQGRPKQRPQAPDFKSRAAGDYER